ncbi:MAG: PQQ-dependent sugar dehydrogenase [Planctomycetes bacterium]|nr:PQQ-dependent sugar dehydrogenase [Planctomycetota bacterium]
MKALALYALVALAWLAPPALSAVNDAKTASSLRVEPAFPNLRFANPLYVTHPRDGSDRLFVVEQAGRVKWFGNRADVKPEDVVTAIDITRRVHSGGEEGLLGMAFHPKVKENHKVYLHYTGQPGQRTVISCFRIDDKLEHIDPTSEEVILTLKQPFSNHNGGMIEFGPDGMLYIGLGDGGAGGDPNNHGQNLDALFAKILRIDVDHRDPGLAYAIPRDNPFVHTDGARGETWAWGLRNPWRFSFDRKTGDLWAGDVGQNLWEEIDLIEKGKNYGWNIFEGTHRFRAPKPADKGPFEKPLADHPHGQSNCITGGYVYRGRRIPALEGAYVYGDFATGLIWIIRYDRDARTATAPLYIARVPAIASFGEDRDGELYITSFDGKVYRFNPAPR